MSARYAARRSTRYPTAVFAPVQGDFKERPPIDLLKDCEEKRFTGLIEVEGADLRGSVLMRGGEVSSLQLQGASGDALDAFLSMQEGRFVLRQKMPTLDGNLTGEAVVRGSLAQHGPADILRFCEGAGLSGQVRMTSAGRRLEVFYEAGAMTAITVDGKTDADLDQAFRWRVGEFAITASPAFAPAKRLDESGLHFLGVVELALQKVIDKAEAVRERDTQQRPIPLVTKRRRKSEAPPPDPQRKVPVYFLDDVVPDRPSQPPPPSTTRHAKQGDVTIELVGPASALEPPRPPAATPTEPFDLTTPRGAPTETGPTHPARLPGTPAPDPGSVATERRPAYREPAPVWVWIIVGACLGGVVVAALARYVF